MWGIKPGIQKTEETEENWVSDKKQLQWSKIFRKWNENMEFIECQLLFGFPDSFLYYDSKVQKRQSLLFFEAM